MEYESAAKPKNLRNMCNTIVGNAREVAHTKIARILFGVSG